jgi:hypothetical protein
MTIKAIKRQAACVWQFTVDARELNLLQWAARISLEKTAPANLATEDRITLTNIATALGQIRKQ